MNTSKTYLFEIYKYVPFIQFKKREKHTWRSVNFSKVAGSGGGRRLKKSSRSREVPKFKDSWEGGLQIFFLGGSKFRSEPAIYEGGSWDP